jgi:hypothetical protein
MPKFSIYIPVALQSALDELDKREVDKNKLFADAMLGYLSLCDDYDPPANTLPDLAIRLKRVEEWVAEQMSEEDEQEKEVTGTIHISNNKTYSLCGSRGRIFGINQAIDALSNPDVTLCIACRRLAKQHGIIGFEETEK